MTGTGSKLSAYVVGSGPNGLTAAILLARAGIRTTVLEAQPTLGGGLRSEELTLPGFTHDVCSAVHPSALSSPAFRSFPLAAHGLEWIHPDAPLAHPLDCGSAVVLERSIESTARNLGPDGARWRSALSPLVSNWEALVGDIFGPLLRIPRHPLALARFGMVAAWPASLVARALRTQPARALFAGIAAHSILPLTHPLSGAFGCILAIAAHAVGWPIPRGGSQSLATALASYFESLGGDIVLNASVRSAGEVEDADLVLWDVTPWQLLAIAGERLPDNYRRRLKDYRYGPGVFKMDWALGAPIPWRSPDCARAATVHLGATFEEIADSEQSVWDGRIARRPFTLLVQPSLFDSTRAPAGRHTAWAYCHVPNGSTTDMSTFIEDQIERFAPGFRATILARSARNTAQLESHNANLVGGDIVGGASTLSQFVVRPAPGLYSTPVHGWYLCSSSTPPGGGVHGMCGYHAARRALADFNVGPAKS